MTQDYKDTLLKYLTGSLSKETGINTPQLGNPISRESLLGYKLDGYNIIDIIQGYQSSYCVIYGNDNNHKGFIAIIDENYNLIEIITKYSSGTDFGEFQLLNVDEEGKFYGIDINNNNPRFIMLNNITLKSPKKDSFSVNLRQSYFLPSPLSNAEKYFAITKAVGQAKYLIGATTKSGNIESPLVTELTVKVGENNDWINYQYTESSDSFIGNDIWASWNEDVIDFKICGHIDTLTQPYYVEYTPNETTLNKTTMLIPTPNGYENGYYEINTSIQNKNISYIGTFAAGAGSLQDITMYLYTPNETTLRYLMGQTGVTTQYFSVPKRIQFHSMGNTTYFMWKCYSIYSNVSELYLTVGRFSYDPNNNNIIIGHQQAITRGDTYEYVFYITNYYNLYNYNILGLDFASSSVGSTNFLIQEIYNQNNYNGLPYENVDSLVPNSAILYDNNDLMLFARNLYNKSVYSNTTLSIIQIPNTMINDISISKKNLIGKTNKTLVSDTQSFTKNIYETVYLNYYNTLLIQNRNTEDYITNQMASNILNLSVSQNTDYDDKKATKFRVNYSDNTSNIFDINPNVAINEEITTTGNNVLTIQNAKEDNAILYTVNGTYSQKTYSGKNKFNKNVIEWVRNNNDDYHSTNNTGTTRIRTQNLTQLEGGVTYTISGIPNGISINAIKFYSSTSSTSSSSYVTTATFTVPSNATYVIFQFAGSNFTDATNVLMKNADIQVEEGSTATNYEKFVGGIPSPNPEYPQEIITIPSIINLFDKNNVDWYRNNSSDYSNNIDTSTNRIRTTSFAINGGNTYTLSGIPEGINLLQIRGYETPSSSAIPISPSNGTFTLDNNIHYIHLLFSGNNFTNDTNIMMKNADLMLVKGNNSKEYIPYGNYLKIKIQNEDRTQEQIVEINLQGNELCKIGDYKDTLSINSSGQVIINKNIAKIQSYNGETITTDYISTTGELTTGATVYYVLSTPQSITLENTYLPLFEGINYITLVDDLETSTSITYNTVSRATYNIAVYVPQDKLIETIDIISNDETTTYQTINNLNSLENGKTYNISQNCYVE